MKNAKQELMALKMKRYHATKPWVEWKANAERVPQERILSCDEIEFILNNRRVIVWWQHPRDAYASVINKMAWEKAGTEPEDEWPSNEKANFKNVGKSRKKVVSYMTSGPSEASKEHYARVNKIKKQLCGSGMSLSIKPSWSRKRSPWATRIKLVAPLIIEHERDLWKAVDLAKKLLKGQTSLEQEFPEYRYEKNDWLSEKHC